MRILGVDPGLRRTGYGVIDWTAGKIKMVQAGVIATCATDGISLRVLDIYRNISDIIKESSPSVLVLEKLYAHYKHPATSILMAHARGVVCLACGVNKLKLVNYPSTRIKKAITGNGHADKRQVQGMVRTILNLTKNPEPVDISDALAMAISYVYIGEKRVPGG